MSNELNKPQNRVERFLAKIAGLVDTKPEAPYTRLERYLDAISGAQDEMSSNIAPEFDSSADYAVGEYVIYDGLLYRCTTAHSGAWNAAHFAQVTVCEEINTRVPVYGRGVNLLDNWHFIGGGSQLGGGQFPINQRGQTVLTGTGYICDRWYERFSSSITNLTANGITSEGGSALIQNFESGGSLLSGLPLTFSTLTKDTGLLTVGCAAYSPEKHFYINAASHTVSYSNKSSSYPNAVVEVRFGDGDCLLAAKLEVGDTQTLAHQDASGNWVLNDPPPNFQQELAKCQRYYQRVTLACDFLADSFGQILVTATLPMQLRTAPNSVTISAPSGAAGSVEVYYNGYVDKSVIDVRSGSPNVVSFRVPGVTANQAFLVNGSITVDAEL